MNKHFFLIATLAVAIFAAIAVGPAYQPALNPVRAQTPEAAFKTLVNFDGTNGATPDLKPLVQGTDGNLYGTAPFGGANGNGTAFKMTPDGALTVLYNFCALPGCADGSGPAPGVVLGRDGDYYGLTTGGGAYGFGTVFKITGAGALTTLHSFDLTDGNYPNSFLVQGTDGSFFGTAAAGGNLAACSGYGCGTIFKITPGGAFTTLHNFCSQTNCSDGAIAYDGVAQGWDGNFYGGTWQGGTDNVGTIYRITPTGELTTLYSFCAQSTCAGGYNPLWLTLGEDENFFGTTFSGGAYGAGAVFKLTPRGDVTTLYSFCAQSDCADGSSPRAGLLLGSDKHLYGTTFYGGATLQNDGTVFKITRAGSLTTLHSFDSADGANPIGPMGQATNGVLYGTTSAAGSDGDGTIFRVSVGLRPFVETVPTADKVGHDILILGTNLTGATRVSFNGAHARFTVVSPTLIRATVPLGAVTGEVRVVTPDGELLSNVHFRVIPTCD